MSKEGVEKHSGTMKKRSANAPKELSCVVAVMLTDGAMISVRGGLRSSLLTEQISSGYLAWGPSLQSLTSESDGKKITQ